MLSGELHRAVTAAMTRMRQAHSLLHLLGGYDFALRNSDHREANINIPQSSGMGSLTNMKRSQDSDERRSSQQDMVGSSGGMFSGWFNQTFKGHQKPSDTEQK